MRGQDLLGQIVVQCKLVPSLYYSLNRLIRPQTLEWHKVLGRKMFVDGEFAIKKYRTRKLLCEDFVSAICSSRGIPVRGGIVSKEEYLIFFCLESEIVNHHRLEDQSQRLEDVGEDNAPVTFLLTNREARSIQQLHLLQDCRFAAFTSSFKQMRLSALSYVKSRDMRSGFVTTFYSPSNSTFTCLAIFTSSALRSLSICRLLE